MPEYQIRLPGRRRRIRKKKKKTGTRPHTTINQPTITTTSSALPAREIDGPLVRPPLAEVTPSTLPSRSITTTTTTTATNKQGGKLAFASSFQGGEGAIPTTGGWTTETPIPSNVTYPTRKVFRCLQTAFLDES